MILFPYNSFTLQTTNSIDTVLQKLSQIVALSRDKDKSYIGKLSKEGFEIWTKTTGTRYPAASFSGTFKCKPEGVAIFVNSRLHAVGYAMYYCAIVLFAICMAIKLIQGSKEWIGCLIVVIAALVLFPFALSLEEKRFRKYLNQLFPQSSYTWNF
jgi:hypothetical protein